MIFFDFDGVLCDLVGGFLNHLWFTERFAFTRADVTEYNIPQALSGGNRYLFDTIDARFWEFLQDKDALVNTCDPVREVWRDFLDWEPCDTEARILTARTGAAYDAARAWCRLWDIDIPIEHVPAMSKVDRLSPGDVLVEDNLAVYESAWGRPELQRLRVLLVAQPWNRSGVADAHGSRLPGDRILKEALHR